MRVGYDATPLIGRRTGVGIYAANVLEQLVSEPGYELDIVATAFSGRGGSHLPTLVPDGVEVRTRPVPARLLRQAWLRAQWPPIELITGRLDVFHGTNFVVPPLRGATGVVTIHDLGYLRNPGTVTADSLAYRELVPLALRYGAHVCTPSRTVARQVRDAYAVSADRVHHTPLGVDPAWMTARPASPAVLAELNVPTSYLVAVGTLEPRKNLPLLVDSYRLAQRQHSDIPPLVIVGAHGWGASLDTDGLPESSVIRTGHVPIDRLRSLVAGADALLFPSIDEGFGLPPLEALACGTPVVSSDLDVTREVLKDQATFADAGSAEAFLEAIQSALERPAGTADSRKAHAQTYTWLACAKATHEAYARAAAT